MAIPQIEWRGVPTRCHHACLASVFEVRQEAEGSTIEIRWAGEQVATHAISDTEGMEGGTRCTLRSPDGRPVAQPGPPPQHRRARRPSSGEAPAPTRHRRRRGRRRARPGPL